MLTSSDRFGDIISVLRSLNLLVAAVFDIARPFGG